MPTIAKLILAQLFSGAGIASGYAVGGMLAERITGQTSMAGFAQMSVILGAGLVAYPLAKLASRVGRRTALTLGFSVGTAGALVVLLGAELGIMPVFMFGMMLCGSSVASGLQARFAATDAVAKGRTGSAMSLVVWATTVGSVLGPNFTAPGAHLGEAFGLNPLAGPYLISMACFALAGLAAFSLGPTRIEVPSVPQPPTGEEPAGGDSVPATDGTATSATEGTGRDDAAERPGLAASLRFLAANPVPRFALVVIVTGQMIMTNVMVMTPVHMDHQAFDLTAVGIVVSFHIVGMYVLSPIFGWAADRFGPRRVIAAGFVVFVATITIGITDALRPTSSMNLLMTALFLLGVGWSMFLIGGSALLVTTVPERLKVPLQGVSDSAMNLGGALMAALAGTMLELGGFVLLNLLAAAVLAITAVFAVLAGAKHRARMRADVDEARAEAAVEA